MAEFRHVLDIDTGGHVLEVEAATTYEEIVEATLARGLLPTVTPELKDITIGGALVGIGIESTGFRHGFVHDGLLEVDVLLASGDVVTCTATNEFSDLFRALPNSYGTLGYVLRARVALTSATPYVSVRVQRFAELRSYLSAMRNACEHPRYDFIDGLMYSPDRFHLICGTFTTDAADLHDIYGSVPYYKQVSSSATFDLRTEDYIFRYDPDWFWNVPEGGLYSAFRRLAPRSVRHSSFYKRYTRWKSHFRFPASRALSREYSEPLIQDWEVPWHAAESMVHFAMAQVDLAGRPWACVPIRVRTRATLYPLEPGELYFNLGSYCWAPSAAGKEPFFNTKLLDDKCFRLGGRKMLYSSTFLSENEFSKYFGGEAYSALKKKYDPHSRLSNLYEKVHARSERLDSR